MLATLKIKLTRDASSCGESIADTVKGLIPECLINCNEWFGFIIACLSNLQYR